MPTSAAYSVFPLDYLNSYGQRDRFSVALYATEERSPEDEKLLTWWEAD